MTRAKLPINLKPGKPKQKCIEFILILFILIVYKVSVRVTKLLYFTDKSEKSSSDSSSDSSSSDSEVDTRTKTEKTSKKKKNKKKAKKKKKNALKKEKRVEDKLKKVRYINCRNMHVYFFYMK